MTIDTTLTLALLAAIGWALRERRTSARLRASRSRTARTLWNLRRRANDMEAAFLEVCIERHALLREVEAKRARQRVKELN